MAVGGDVGVGTCSVIGVGWLGTTTGVAVGLGMAVSAGAAAGTGVAVGSGVLGSAGTVGMRPSFTTGVGVESSASTSILICSVGSGSPWQPRARARVTRAQQHQGQQPRAGIEPVHHFHLLRTKPLSGAGSFLRLHRL